MSKKKVVIATPQSQGVTAVEDEINKDLEEGVEVDDIDEDEDEEEEETEPEEKVDEIVVPDVVIQKEVVVPAPVKTADKNVRIRMRVGHHCSIGGEEYNLNAGQCYNVPESVKRILNKAGLLSPL